ncbi:hypothetical protein D918_05886 [Trichuris suis]|nr:hypothetical protein D918_05886 [Trichuris suis]
MLPSEPLRKRPYPLFTGRTLCQYDYHKKELENPSADTCSWSILLRTLSFSELCVVIMPVPSESPPSEATEDDVRPKPSPFERKFVSVESDEALRFKDEVADCLRCLNAPETSEYGRLVQEPQPLTDEQVERAASIFARRWKLKDGLSEVAFKGLLLILEHLLAYEVTNHASFAYFVETLGFHTVFFWKKTVPLLYDSDMQFGTNYRDSLLLA